MKDNSHSDLLDKYKMLTDQIDGLQKKLDQFENLSNLVPGVFYEFCSDKNGDFSINFLSKSGENVFGRPLGDLTDTSKFLDFLHPEDVEGFLHSIQKSKNEMAEWNHIFRVISGRDSIVIWIHGKSIPQKQNNGSVIWYGLMQNITARKKAELALLENEKRFRTISDNSPDAIFISDFEGNYVYTNQEATNLLGYSTNELLQMNVIDVVERFKNEKNISAYKNLFTGKKYFFESYLIHKNGTIIPVDISAVLLDDGTIYASCRNSTERKNFEKEIIHAKVKAEEADRLKSAFLANMSHEIRTPMNGILGFTSLLKEPGLNGDDQQKYIEIIQKSGERMLNTVNDIVEISKIDAGQININLSKVNITKHLKTLQDFFSLETETKGLDFLIDNKLTEQETRIRTDKSKMSSILSNLIKNAIKFTHHGAIKVGCIKEKEWIKFYVSDDGIGIPKDRTEAIFNRFEQADIGESRSYEGSGLGLSIAKSYVEMLGGKIWVESEVHKGSTFYFTIAHNMEKYLPANGEMQPENISSLHKKKSLKVLAAEDDEVSRIHLEIILKDIAKDLVFANNGADAVDKVKNNGSFDLVLMDIRMPKMDGLEATKKIREFNQNIIIIAQTAFALEGDRQKAIDAGCTDYISKPFLKKDVLRIIDKYTKITGSN